MCLRCGRKSFLGSLKESQLRGAVFCSGSTCWTPVWMWFLYLIRTQHPLSPSLGAHSEHLTPTGRGGGGGGGESVLHTMAVEHGVHTACARNSKLKAALKPQPFLGIRRRNDMRNVKYITGKKQKTKNKKLVILPGATFTVRSRI